MSSNVIFSMSVQQTGTWFLLNLIKQHPQVDSLQLVGNYFEKIEGCCGRQFLESVIDMWFKNRIWSEQAPEACVREVADKLVSLLPTPPAGKKMLLHSHLSRGDGKGNRHTTLNPASPSFHGMFLEQCMHSYRTAIPIRDPLKSLITRQRRHSRLDHRYLIDGFEGLARCPADVFFFPIDLFERLEDRRRLVADLFKFLELPDYIDKVVEAWTPANTSGHYAMKDWYKNGELEKIRQVIPEEYAALKKSESLIRPFLESLGYRDLMWWD